MERRLSEYLKEASGLHDFFMIGSVHFPRVISLFLHVLRHRSVAAVETAR
jgi:hypothetical protein